MILKPHFLIFLFLIDLSVLSAQTDHRLLHPSLDDVYESYQILPNGGLRVFAKSGQLADYYGQYQLIYTDLLPGYSLDGSIIETVHIPDSYYWNWPSEDYVFLNFSDGSTMMMNDILPCDVEETGSLVKMKSDGQINWFVELGDSIIFTAERIIFLDTNRIGIISAYSEPDLLIDWSGNIISQIDIEPPFDKIIQTSIGYIASNDNHLYVLNQNFDTILSYEVNEKILSFDSYPGENYIINTLSKHYLLKENHQLELIPISGSDKIWFSHNYFWVFQQGGDQLVKLDTQFTLVDTLRFPPGVTPVLGFPLNDSLVLISQFQNGINTGLLLYQGHEDEIQFDLSYDIGITNILIPDTVEVFYLQQSIFNGGWYHFYDYIFIDVKNYGTDTIFKFTITDPQVEECAYCWQQYNHWIIDSLAIPPGGEVTISLGAYEPMCQYNEPGELCLQAIRPNDDADANFLNDSHCQAFSVFVSTEETAEEFIFQIGPNPASDYVYFTTDYTNRQRIQFFDNYGRQVIDRQLNSSFEEINIEHLPAGLYTILVTQDNGLHKSFKLSIIR